MKQDNLIEKGYLQVNTIHSIYYEVCGNTNDVPILFVHGGPGAGFSDSDKRFFDFKKQKVIFFDQRGSSKSVPFGCIEENTTQDLVNDINTLLKHLGIPKVYLFGGSWGTTLSLIFAIQNPEKVKSILLRGIFLANKESIEYFISGGVENQFPKEWNRFKNNVPITNQENIAAYYLDKMLNGNDKEKDFFSYEWAYYEISIFKNDITETEIQSILKEFAYRSLSIMEAYYLINNCFIEDNYILQNISALQSIPVKIIHGRNDNICPLIYAETLHQKLINSELYIENAGHSDSEPDIENRIIEIIKKEFD
ncbi:MAG TPA: prolyl aminopeptidase [Flavobacterium sp.]|uniref:prolyl aminopeptidase n=1 Tax=Flavobacterium sp. TaxID=239 RepID=UPI002DB82E83|nr:prolyl aminopeptidase [Flavobacterium sp.]HEU4791020.1 prolyl aminopeptidase [Flavobacterium sp.]